MPFANSSPRPRFTVAVVTPRRELYRAAADCLRASANLAWAERLARNPGLVPPDAVLIFADDFKMIDAYGAIESELLGVRVRCVVVVARHPADYQSLASLPGAARRFTLLQPSTWELSILNAILSRLESSA